MEGTQSGPGGASVISGIQHLDARFFKTRLCAFNMGGNCARGARCTFAHSAVQLMKQPELKCTKICRNVSTKAGCSWGDSCRFAHCSQRPLPKMASLYPMLEAASQKPKVQAPPIASVGENLRQPMGWNSDTECPDLQLYNDTISKHNACCAQARLPVSRESTTYSERSDEHSLPDEDYEAQLCHDPIQAKAQETQPGAWYSGDSAERWADMTIEFDSQYFAPGFEGHCPAEARRCQAAWGS
mmetsp:Transcript_51194/g.111120  ORF Transcript_51194/g.111120 Transcript_51194/m.111120 type:complete len:242 (+) Transcript_51194:51-776(+)